RLLAARQQVDRRVPLAGRLRHHLDARIEDLVAGQDQFRLATAEELREQLAEVAVDRVVGLLQQLAGLAIDAPDRVLERADRLVQVGRLPVQEALALAGLRELVERSQIHRAQRGDRVGQARHLALQPRRPRRLRERHAQRSDACLVDLRFGQLLRVLFGVHARGLLLELELGQLLPQRFLGALGRETLLLAVAQLLRQVVEPLSRRRQCLLGTAARVERVLQRLPCGRVGQLLQLLEQARTLGRGLLGQRLSLGQQRFEALQIAFDRADRERSFLRLALLLPERLATIGQLALGLLERELQLFGALLTLAELRIELLEPAGLGGDRALELANLHRQFLELAVDALPALGDPRALLLEPLRVQPQ